MPGDSGQEWAATVQDLHRGVRTWLPLCANTMGAGIRYQSACRRYEFEAAVFGCFRQHGILSSNHSNQSIVAEGVEGETTGGVVALNLRVAVHNQFILGGLDS